MGKGIVFLPIIIFFGFFGLIVAGFFLIVFKLIKKSKASHWQGKLIDKKHLQARDFDTDLMNDYYTLIFKTTEDKQIKVGVSKKVYDEYKIGDKAEKRKGELHPRKL